MKNAMGAVIGVPLIIAAGVLATAVSLLLLWLALGLLLHYWYFVFLGLLALYGVVWIGSWIHERLST